jgi:hypothetical protein
MAVEFGVRALLAPRHAAWVIRPILYSALPKPGQREHAIALILAAGGILVAVWFIWFLKAVPERQLLALRLGVGLSGGAAVGLLVASALFGLDDVFVLRIGAWGYAFDPFELPGLIGLVLVLRSLSGSSLDDAFRSARWRDLLLPRRVQ